MESKISVSGVLSQIPSPAFTVKNKKILQVNQEAEQLQLTPGMELAPLLQDNIYAYDAFEGGNLYMVMDVAEKTVGVTVTREQDVDLFVLDNETPIRLQALALAAKELRGSLAEIFFITERFKRSATLPRDNMQAAYLQSIAQMQRVISNMADAAAYEQGCRLELSAVNLTALYAEAFEKASSLLGDSGPKLCYHGLQEPVISMADPKKLQRAIYNLISNAVKFTPKDGTVEAWLTQCGSQLQLTVQDSGEGVAPHVQSTFFTRYRRAPCIEDGRHGLGLGLLLVRSIAIMHGGTVLLQQTPGQGARIGFTVTLNKLPSGKLFSHPLIVNYTGGKDPALLELSDVLPLSAFQ